jgi:hypothetical protein
MSRSSMSSHAGIASGRGVSARRGGCMTPDGRVPGPAAAQRLPSS